MAQKVKNLPAIQETQVQSLGQEATLRREWQPTPVLAWRIPWTKEPGRLQSMGLQRVSHYWVTNTYNTHYINNRKLAFTRIYLQIILYCYWCQMVLVVKKLSANAGDPRDVDLIPGWGRFLGEGNGNPLQYSCLESSMDRGAWWATVYGVTVRHDWATEYTHITCIV